MNGERFRTRVTQLTVLPVGEPLYCEFATVVELEDEAAGEFVVVRQQCGTVEEEKQAVRIMPEEWPAVRAAVDQLMEGIEAEGGAE